MKLLVSLNNKDLADYLNYTNSFIIGLKEFCINYLEFSILEIKNLLEKYPNIELFVSVNKNIFNEDLGSLEKDLNELDKLPIKGVLFYDLAVLYLAKKNHYHFGLVWHQGHMVTNYNTCNYYGDKGCKYAFLASEITVDEIKEIREKTSIRLIGLLFGYPMISFSKRDLLSNYASYHGVELDGIKTIKSGNSANYLIEENKHGTSIWYGKILNGIHPLHDLINTLDYAVLSENLIDHDLFIKCLAIYDQVLKNKLDYQKGEEELGRLIDSDDTVFFYKKTIYKVKDEKKN